MKQYWWHICLHTTFTGALYLVLTATHPYLHSATLLKSTAGQAGLCFRTTPQRCHPVL